MRVLEPFESRETLTIKTIGPVRMLPYKTLTPYVRSIFVLQSVEDLSG